MPGIYVLLILYGLFVAFGALLSIGNWLMLLESRRTGAHHSPVPLFGGVCLLVAFLIHPETRPFWWMALFIDYGTFFLLWGVPWLIWESWQEARRGPDQHYWGHRGDVTVGLWIHRDGTFTLEKRSNGPAVGGNPVEVKVSGRWKRSESRVTLISEGRAITLRPVSVRLCDTLREETDRRDDTPDTPGLLGGVTLRRM